MGVQGVCSGGGGLLEQMFRFAVVNKLTNADGKRMNPKPETLNPKIQKDTLAALQTRGGASLEQTWLRSGQRQVGGRTATHEGCRISYIYVYIF